MVCNDCGSDLCDGACETKVNELAGIVGQIGVPELRSLLLGAGGNVNR